jgi:hypothetical protein
MIKVTIEIRLQHRKLNRNRGFNFSWFWSLITNMIKQYRHTNPSKLMTQPTSPSLAHAVSIMSYRLVYTWNGLDPMPHWIRMLEIEMVPEILVVFNQLIQQIA